MSVDLLQEKIRKKKNPSVVDLTTSPDRIPPSLLQVNPNWLDAYAAFIRKLMHTLREIVPAVRFQFAGFSLYGAEGLDLLKKLLEEAKDLGYYVLLDSVQILSPQMAQLAADILLKEDSQWMFDGLVVPTFIGSDGLKPFAEKMKGTDKSLFGVIRTGNKSAAELQDLLTGNRLSHTAAADLVNRLGEPMPARNGYHMIGAMTGASSADGIRTLRSKYPRLFLLLDGYDYPNANAKNCSFAFDRFGYGAAACAGDSIVGAWKYVECDGSEFYLYAAEAAERMKRNLCKYITIL